MRGLDTRCLMAQTHVLWRLDAKAASEQFLRVQRMAFDEGYKDAANGETTPPLMLKDEPCLEGQWYEGFWKYHDERRQELEERAEEERFDAVQLAISQGYHDWKAGRREAPEEYKADTELSRACDQGQGQADMPDILANCSGCQNAHGLPCSVHV